MEGDPAMSYHIVSIDSPQCSLSCRDGQLTCRTAGMLCGVAPESAED